MQTFVLDTETTGLCGRFAGGRDEIVELAIVDSHGCPVINTLVRPTQRKTWPEAERIHGISPADVGTSPTLDDLLPEIRKIVSGNRIVIYNADFDLQFFPHDVFSASKVCCAMLAFAEYRGDWNDYYDGFRWYKLAVAANATGFNGDVDWHRALGDALAARHVWMHIKKGKLGNGA